MTHVPVLLHEAIEALNIRPGGTVIDCTLGRGGHSFEIASRLTTGRLVAIDRDMRAIEASREKLTPFGERVTLVHGTFGLLDEILDDLGIDKVDGIFADFGVSSPQIDEKNRGFSYGDADSPLDMRMDETSPLTAREIVNTWDEQSLKRILFDYGEERYGARIASAILRRRSERAIETAGDLVAIIKSAMPNAALREPQHPAKRTFQALRIAVNDELGEIERLLNVIPERLNFQGRAVCISFHSLEDRLVKNAFNARINGCTCPKSFPVCVCGFKPTLKLITKKPVAPGDDEIRENPRSRSAKMRVAERL